MVTYKQKAAVLLSETQQGHLNENVKIKSAFTFRNWSNKVHLAKSVVQNYS
jgi:hypothetical protein